jgi:hypothetical protein
MPDPNVAGQWNYQFMLLACGPEVTGTDWGVVTAGVFTPLTPTDTLATFEARRAANARAWLLSLYPTASIPATGVALLSYKLM